jgi:hypothetical protein
MGKTRWEKVYPHLIFRGKVETCMGKTHGFSQIFRLKIRIYKAKIVIIPNLVFPTIFNGENSKKEGEKEKKFSPSRGIKFEKNVRMGEKRGKLLGKADFFPVFVGNGESENAKKKEEKNVFK